MKPKTTKIYLGNLNGKDIYAVGPYAQDIKRIMDMQTKQIGELRAKVARLEKSDKTKGFDFQVRSNY